VGHKATKQKNQYWLRQMLAAPRKVAQYYFIGYPICMAYYYISGAKDALDEMAGYAPHVYQLIHAAIRYGLWLFILAGIVWAIAHLAWLSGRITVTLGHEWDEIEDAKIKGITYIPS
jgi:hypothetical protein